MINEAMKCEAEKRYGTLSRINDKGRVTVFNEQGFAKLFVLAENPVFLSEEKAFYHYEPKTGLWRSQAQEEMIERLGLFLLECARLFDVPVLETKRKQFVLNSILNFLTAMCRQPNFFKQTDLSFIYSHVWKFSAETEDYLCDVLNKLSISPATISAFSLFDRMAYISK